MSFSKLCTDFELIFYHEFINDENFPEAKKKLIEKDLGHYYIPNDFTIYQIKSNPVDSINQQDYSDNQATVAIMLANMPGFKAENFIEYHYTKYYGEKKKFLKSFICEFKGSKFTQGEKEISPPMVHQVAIKWCEDKLDEINNTYNSKKKSQKAFININRITELKQITSNDFDLQKLTKLLEEINDNFALDNFLSVAVLGRAVLDHIPPIFNLKTFTEVANNYGSSSFKKNMGHLNNSMRSIADNYLHNPIGKKEPMCNENQIDFSRELDFLLAEILKRLS